MDLRRFDRYVDRIHQKLHRAFVEKHTPREIARSFALGTFILMLPTLGVGLLLCVAIIYVFDRVSRLALLAAAVMFNPVVKSGIYVASFALGMLLLGPIEGISMTDVSLNAGAEIVVRLLIGNLLLAILTTVVSYVVVHRLAVRYASTDNAETSKTLEDVTEDV